MNKIYFITEKMDSVTGIVDILLNKDLIFQKLILLYEETVFFPLLKNTSKESLKNFRRDTLCLMSLSDLSCFPILKR